MEDSEEIERDEEDANYEAERVKLKKDLYVLGTGFKKLFFDNLYVDRHEKLPEEMYIIKNVSKYDPSLMWSRPKGRGIPSLEDLDHYDRMYEEQKTTSTKLRIEDMRNPYWRSTLNEEQLKLLEEEQRKNYFNTYLEREFDDDEVLALLDNDPEAAAKYIKKTDKQVQKLEEEDGLDQMIYENFMTKYAPMYEKVHGKIESGEIESEDSDLMPVGLVDRNPSLFLDEFEL
mmetsp:Transcript_28465/g.25296  ORF Transcript_28465/g.25296 Transcript_28465/m.25296 type:complete len:230 (+) Transcript_28465:4869-5558(+)